MTFLSLGAYRSSGFNLSSKGLGFEFRVPNVRCSRTSLCGTGLGFVVHGCAESFREGDMGPNDSTHYWGQGTHLRTDDGLRFRASLQKAYGPP